MKTKNHKKTVRLFQTIFIDFLAKTDHRKKTVFFFLIFLFIFSRFFELEKRAVFGWDQVVNSWVMREMILFGKRPLLGMIAKANTGFYIGPLYYYMMVPFYYFSNLDPIAGSIFAGVIALITFIFYYLIVHKIFGFKTAFFSAFIYILSSHIIIQDRIPWPVILLQFTSIVIFYSLLKALRGDLRYLLLAAVTCGFSFHAHFTAVYFVIIIAIFMPWILWKVTGAAKRILQALPLFLVFFVPNIISEIKSKYMYVGNMTGYLEANFHGLHLRRIMQLSGDAFIEFISIIEKIPFMKNIPYYHLLIPAIFMLLLLRNKQFVLIALTSVWFLVPWVIMSLYKGEISNYYFAITRPVVLMIIGYLMTRIVNLKNMAAYIVITGFIFVFGYYNIKHYLISSLSKLPLQREYVKAAIRENKVIEFSPGEPEAYLYEIYDKYWGLTGNE